MAETKKREASIKETGEELPDDQWRRFEAAVDAAVKSGPKHKETKRPKAKSDARKTGPQDGSVD